MSKSGSGISRRRLLGAAGAASTLAMLPSTRLFGQTPSRRQPNIVFIMADDMGYADAGCYGARAIRTPHIDAIAAGGVQLFQGYANSPVCSPTRTALITGRYQYRLRYGLEEPGGASGLGLPPGLPTMPEQFRQLGYRTALVGKWHLGVLPNYGPLKSGYERFYGIPIGAADYFRHAVLADGYSKESILTEGEVTVEHHGYLTDLLGERAVTEVKQAAADSKPLFLSLHFTAPHWPWIGPEDEAVSQSLEDFLHVDGGNLATYAKMVESMDANIGKVLRALEESGQADNTIVVFTSDNGGERFSDTWPFVGTKTELLEGGIRVPLLVKWPEKIPAGSTSQQVMISMDFLPTLLAAAGATAEPGFAPDGENLLDVLTGTQPERERTLFWRYKAFDQRAVRQGDWKYLQLGGKEYLFNLAEDQRERANKKELEPERFNHLKQLFAEWDKGMLAYTPESRSHSISGFVADRYPYEG